MCGRKDARRCESPIRGVQHAQLCSMHGSSAGKEVNQHGS